MNVNNRTDWQPGEQVFCKSKKTIERFSGTVHSIITEDSKEIGVWVQNPRGKYFAKYDLFNVYPMEGEK